MDFPHWWIRFLVGVSPTGVGIFPHWLSAFSNPCRSSPGRLREFGGVLDGFDSRPFVGRVLAQGVKVSQPKFVGRPKLAVSSSSAHGDSNKAERLAFADRRCDGVSINPVFFEVLKRDRKLAVVVAAVMSKLDFNPGQHAMAGLAQNTKGWGLQHSDQSRDKLLRELIAALVLGTAAPGHGRTLCS